MMNTQALLLVAEDDADDQYFFQEAIRVVCPDEVEMRFVLDGAQLRELLLQPGEHPQHLVAGRGRGRRRLRRGRRRGR